jgi:TolA-binding protein
MRSATNGFWATWTGRAALAAVVLVAAAGCGGNQQATKDRLAAAYGELANPQPNYAEVAAAADQYLQENPSGPDAADALYLRGRAMETKGQRDPASPAKDFADAHNYYTQAAAQNPRPALEGLIHAGIGNVLYFQERYGQAIGELSTAYDKLEKPDDKAWALYRIGLSQQRMGRWDDADKNFALVQQHFPNTVQAQRAREKQGARAFWVQVGAYSTPQQADAVVADLKKAGMPALRFAEPSGKGTQYVRAGPLPTYEQAVAAKNRVEKKYGTVVILP